MRSPVHGTKKTISRAGHVTSCPKMGDHPPRLNTHDRPIANKYCEGKLARTLEKELEEPEVVLVEAIDCRTSWQVLWCMVSVMAVCVAQCLLCGCDG